MRGLIPITRRRHDLLTVFDWHGDTPWVHRDDGALRHVLVKRSAMPSSSPSTAASRSKRGCFRRDQQV
jgi:hypothetical protein